jgi:hypothetical protein
MVLVYDMIVLVYNMIVLVAHKRVHIFSTPACSPTHFATLAEAPFTAVFQRLDATAYACGYVACLCALGSLC